MSAKPTGGPAFPSQQAIIPSGHGGTIDVSRQYDIAKGLTVRDYFAGKAMQTLIYSLGGYHATPEQIVTEAYSFADAMLKARAA